MSTSPSFVQFITPSFAPSFAPSFTSSIPSSIPPSIPPSFTSSIPPSFTSSMPQSIPPTIATIPSNPNPNPQENQCNCPITTSLPSPLPKCNYNNISYNTGSLTDCSCPSDNQLRITNNIYASFDQKRSGNGTFNVRTNMCQMNNTKYLINDINNVYKETICVDNQYNSTTGGSVRKYWCSNV